VRKHLIHLPTLKICFFRQEVSTSAIMKDGEDMDRLRMKFYRRWIGLVLPAVLVVAGCGPDTPFSMAPVAGKVVYADGSPFPGKGVRITFIPQDVSPADKSHPLPAQSMLAEDGSFKELTSHKFGDGAIVGRHKVILVDHTPGGNAVPEQYRQESTTPLEAIVKRGKNYFEFKIEKREPQGNK